MLSPRILSNLIRYHKNKLFLGIRYGNLWGYDLLRQVANPAFVEGVTLMQQADLALAHGPVAAIGPCRSPLGCRERHLQRRKICVTRGNQHVSEVLRAVGATHLDPPSPQEDRPCLL